MPQALALPQKKPASKKSRHAERLMRRDNKHAKGLIAAFVVFSPAALIWLVGNTGPSRRGGTIAGLLLGVYAVFLLLLLTFYGWRKHHPLWAWGTREGWMRTHAYVGIVAGVVVLFHSGFHFGGVIAAMAGSAYLLTVLSGVFGLILYGTIPKLMTATEDELTMGELMEKITSLQDEIKKMADGRTGPFKQVAKQETRPIKSKLGVSLLFQSKKKQRETGKAEAIASKLQQCAPEEREDFRKMFVLIMQKSKFEERLLPKARYLMMLHGWMKFHLPLTAAVYAATALHVVSIVYYGIVIP